MSNIIEIHITIHQGDGEGQSWLDVRMWDSKNLFQELRESCVGFSWHMWPMILKGLFESLKDRLKMWDEGKGRC